MFEKLEPLEYKGTRNINIRFPLIRFIGGLDKHGYLIGGPMNRLLLVVILALIIADNAIAQSKSWIVFAVQQPKPVAASIVRRPDYLAVPVRISSSQKEPEQRFKEISQARRILLTEAEKNKIKVHTGPVYLSPTSESLLKSSYSSSYQSSQAVMHLLVSLSDEKLDVFDAAARAANIVNNTKAPGKALYEILPVELAVDNPEEYRSELLKALNKEMERIQETLKKRVKVTISGLEGPVLLRQIDDSQVELFIDHKLSIELDGK